MRGHTCHRAGQHCDDEYIHTKTRNHRGDRLTHSARADRRPVAHHDHLRQGHPRTRLRHGGGHHDLVEPEPGQHRQQPGHRRLLQRRAGGRSARPRPQPYAGADQRPPHRRLPAIVQRREQLHRHHQHPHIDDRARGDPHRQRLGDLRLGRDLRRRQLHHEEEGRRHHARFPRRRYPARRRSLATLHPDQRLVERQVRFDLWRGVVQPESAVGLPARLSGLAHQRSALRHQSDARRRADLRHPRRR